MSKDKLKDQYKSEDYSETNRIVQCWKDNICPFINERTRGVTKIIK